MLGVVVVGQNELSSEGVKANELDVTFCDHTTFVLLSAPIVVSDAESEFCRNVAYPEGLA